MKDSDIDILVSTLQEKIKEFKTPIVTEYAESSRKQPFHILISTILSLRTKDKTTEKASNLLFVKANTPKEMLKLSTKEIEKTIYPVGFYRVKANNIKKVCLILIEQYNGSVPASLDELLLLPGVGRKTANLVVTLGYGKLGICVDVHVHRIMNRLGYVKTKNPLETEMALREKLPRKYWIDINTLLVAYGQNHCKPIKPLCTTCKIENICSKIGVKG